MNTDAAGVRVRRMSAADLERVRAIAESLEDAPHWPLAAYAAAVHPEGEPQRIALVAETVESGAVMGFAMASVVGPQAELETIAVAAEGQRRGVGRRLFAALREELKRAEVRAVLLEVRTSNHPALGLYRALGFAAAGRRPRYYADPVEDAVLMELRLG
jgi:ribosomal-protein-alanine N-acetyltransferase